MTKPKENPPVNYVNMTELERNALKYSQLRYILSELVESHSPSSILNLIMDLMVDLTGGDAIIAKRKGPGIWEMFSPFEDEPITWKPTRPYLADIYETSIREGPMIFTSKDNQNENLSEKHQEALKAHDYKNALVIPGDTKNLDFVIEVNDINLIEHLERYQKELEDFILPLAFTIETALHLDEIQESQRESNLLLDLLIHDIRNHITNTRMALELLNINPDHLESIQIARNQMKEAEKLVERVRNTLVPGEEMQLQPIHLREVVEDSIQTAIADTNVGDVDLIVEDTNAPENPTVLANELLADVFVNLFTNAIKYTKQTPKIIELEWKPWKSNPVFLHIRISDHGVGISDEKKAQATERFGLTSDKGFGLGLSVVSRLLDSYNGYFWLSNRIPNDPK
ncbi:MAG: hypothetical protein GF309_00145, partial [Candidatus Lokiarchaeota archaeon]|nr:hypothetical protein [Candidatus Lokiarchaeota archaeon]